MDALQPPPARRGCWALGAGGRDLHPRSHSASGDAPPRPSSNAAEPWLKVFLQELSANPNPRGIAQIPLQIPAPPPRPPGAICEKTLVAQKCLNLRAARRA